MGRIRTVKPELFEHEELFDAEKNDGLPLRLAFIGLFTCCDREGRFKWRPRTLKKNIMPHDEIDFSRVLDALATRGFVRKYAIGTEEYGVIPTWHKHQVINNRESESDIPEPEENSYISITSTREARVNDASATEVKGCKGEGKGKEGKGTGKENTIVELPLDVPVKVDPVEEVFDYWRKRMNSPRSELDKDRRKHIETALKTYSPREICEAIKGCSLTPHNMGVNDNKTKYNGLNVILRSADNIDRFIGTARSRPNAQNADEPQTEDQLLADVQAALNRMTGGVSESPVDDPNVIDMEMPDAQH